MTSPTDRDRGRGVMVASGHPPAGGVAGSVPGPVAHPDAGAGSLDYGQFQALHHFKGLDGLRAVGALSVIFEHVREYAPGDYLRWRFGSLGVDLFFVISGFLIVTLLLRERRQSGAIHLGRFYARRALRIFPIYYLMIAGVVGFYLIISPWKPDGLKFYLSTGLVHALYLQDLVFVAPGIFFHCWSLALEEQFYLVWPSIEKYAPATLRYGALAAGLIVCEASNFGLTNAAVDRFYGMPDAHEKPLFVCTFAPMILGTLLAHALDDPTAYARVRRVVSAVWVVPACLAVVAAIVYFLPDQLPGAPRLLVHLAMTIALASIVVTPAARPASLLALPPMVAVGRVSYGLYLYHILVVILFTQTLGWLAWRWPPLPVAYLCVVGPTFLLARLSYARIEKPLLDLRSRFRDQPARDPARGEERGLAQPSGAGSP